MHRAGQAPGAHRDWQWRHSVVPDDKPRVRRATPRRPRSGVRREVPCTQSMLCIMYLYRSFKPIDTYLTTSLPQRPAEAGRNHGTILRDPEKVAPTRTYLGSRYCCRISPKVEAAVRNTSPGRDCISLDSVRNDSL